MAVKYRKKKHRQNNIAYTIVTVILLCAVFLTMVSYIYTDAEESAYETLHVQTKQIKDDITLQLISDRENLLTMANFAAKLYSDGESYSLMFDSFKAIGLIENIGILNPDNTFVTKTGSADLTGLISFEDEKERGVYISGRVKDLTKADKELIRTAVPINVNGDVVGILYGVIKLDKIGARYSQMAQELDAQLFVYDKEEGNLVIDTVHKELGNISFLKDRKYNKDYSFEQMMSTDKGYTSFVSAYRNENLHLHYSTVDDIGWMIAFGRYDSQVFSKTHKLAYILAFVFLSMLAIIVLYIIILMANDRFTNSVTNCASEVRKELLETIDGQNNIFDALVVVCKFAKSNSSMFFDTAGDDYNYILPEYKSVKFLKNERSYFKTELFRYVAELHKKKKTNISVMCITPNKHLLKTNPSFYTFLKERKINDVSFAAIVKSSSNTTILGVINPKHGKAARLLAERVVACFSMALYNKNHISETEIAATTDVLTGVLNRVAYESDLLAFDKEKPSDFSCVYIDVNELHICNNKYGHAAGDEMLMYIANALKEIFAGHKIYRIGGDEFLVFTKNTEKRVVDKNIEELINQLKLRNYHVAIGMSYRIANNNTAQIVKEAEVKMYKEKAMYYQEKELQNETAMENKEYIHMKTGIVEIDKVLSVMNENYSGICCVSLETDKAKRIMMPAYLDYGENEEKFSILFSKYVSEAVEPDYHRALTSFLNYDVIKNQLANGKIPKIRYKKTNDESVVLSVYEISDKDNAEFDTLWVFAKE